jgi:hypothetical protein
MVRDRQRLRLLAALAALAAAALEQEGLAAREHQARETTAVQGQATAAAVAVVQAQPAQSLGRAPEETEAMERLRRLQEAVSLGQAAAAAVPAAQAPAGQEAAGLARPIP